MFRKIHFRWHLAGMAGQILILMILLTACSTSTYELGEYKEMRVGTYTRDGESLASVQRVALVAFNGKSRTSASVQEFSPLIDLAYQQALASISAQSTLEFVPAEQVVASMEYIRARAALDPQEYYSPIEGLTDLAGDLQGVDISALCDDLQVDALLIYRIEFDWEFPTWNVVAMKTLQHVLLVVPPDARAVWEIKQVKWKETMVYTPDNFKLLLVGNPTAEEWTTIIDTAAEMPDVRVAGGAPLYFLGEDAAQAR